MNFEELNEKYKFKFIVFKGIRGITPTKNRNEFHKIMHRVRKVKLDLMAFLEAKQNKKGETGK